MKKILMILSLAVQFLSGIFLFFMFFWIIAGVFLVLDMIKDAVKSEPTVMHVEKSKYHSVSFRGSGYSHTEARLDGYIVYGNNTVATRCNITVTDSIIQDERIKMFRLPNGQKMIFDQYLAINDSIVPVWATRGEGKSRFRRNQTATAQYSSYSILRSIAFLLLSILACILVRCLSKILYKKTEKYYA